MNKKLKKKRFTSKAIFVGLTTLIFGQLYFSAAWSAGGGGDEDTPVDIREKVLSMNGEKTTEWKAPDYSGQEGRLGYDPAAFRASEGLKGRVAFWKDIYSKYTSDFGLLHDSESINAIYQVLDFSSIPGIDEMTPGEQKKARKKLVKDSKHQVKLQLDRLHDHLKAKKSSEELSEEDRLIWEQFAKDKRRNKFRLAKKKGRLRLQLGLRDHFQNGIFYSGRYLEEMEAIFKEYNLPAELIRLVFVESSFNIFARSKVGASGIWQFMRYTARPLLKMNRVIDRRNDPIPATKAAAKMLASNYKMLKSWPLAITGYNYGPSGVRRLTRKYKTRSIEELIEKVNYSRFGFASQNFYASFLAAVEVEKNADQYFTSSKMPVMVSTPPEMKSFRLAKSVKWKDIIDFFEGNEILASIYNPAFTAGVRNGFVRIPKGTEINIQPGQEKAVERKIASLPEVRHVDRYKVRRGDTLSEIAERFNTRVSKLMAKNGLKYAHRLRVGQVLHIPSN